MGVLALVGTRKGLFMATGDDTRRRWRVEGPVFAGWGVYHATVDPRDAGIYVAANHIVYGPTVQRSTDGGRTWMRSRKIRLPEARAHGQRTVVRGAGTARRARDALPRRGPRSALPLRRPRGELGADPRHS